MSTAGNTRDKISATKPNDTKHISDSSSGSKQSAVNSTEIELVSIQNRASSIANGERNDNVEESKTRHVSCKTKILEVKDRIKLFKDQINDPDHPYSWICLALFDVVETVLTLQSLYEMNQAGHSEGDLSDEFKAFVFSFILNMVGFIPLVTGIYICVSKSGSIHKKKSRAYVLYLLYHIQEMVSDSIRAAAGISYYYRFEQFEDGSKLTMYSTLSAIAGIIYFWKTLMEVAIERLELHPYNIPKKLFSQLNMFKHCCVCGFAFSLVLFIIVY